MAEGAAMEEEPLAADEDLAKKSDPDAACPAVANGCFDCNICLDFAAEPVVTLCGHLYCWPCIYKWLQEAAGGAAASATRQCPVCKAALSEDTLVPLYGRGHSAKKPQHGLGIPRRPTMHREAVEYQTPRAEEELEAAAGFESPLQALSYLAPSSPPAGSRVIHSMAGGVIGGMAGAVLPWVLRNQAPAASMYYYASPYDVAGNGGSPRQRRRQEMEVERSLHQIWFFLFIFVLMCLLWF